MLATLPKLPQGGVMAHPRGRGPTGGWLPLPFRGGAQLVRHIALFEIAPSKHRHEPEAQLPQPSVIIAVRSVGPLPQAL